MLDQALHLFVLPVAGQRLQRFHNLGMQGPAPLLERRRQYKIGDARVQRVLRLREIG